MFCLKCGEAIPDDSNICPKCGENPREEIESQQEAVVYATPEAPTAPAIASRGGKKTAWIIAGVIGAVVCIVLIVLIVNAVQTSRLKESLMREWYAPSDSILKVLEFDDDKAEYRLETGYAWMDTTLFDKPYKVINGSSFKIQRFKDSWETYKVTFNDDKTIMTVTPAITSTDSSERWYDIED